MRRRSWRTTLPTLLIGLLLLQALTLRAVAAPDAHPASPPAASTSSAPGNAPTSPPSPARSAHDPFGVPGP
jgi:hypothetical protein